MLAGIRASLNRPRSALLGFSLVLPSMIVILLLILYPLAFSLILSLGKVGANFKGYTFVGLRNYAAILSDPYVWLSFRITLQWVVGVTILLQLVALGGALLLNTDIRGRAIFRALLLVPWAVPSVANGILWLSIYNSSYGALSGILYQLGIIRDYTIGWLETPWLAMVSVTVAQVWKWSPFATLVLLAALQSIPNELYESAKIDGAGVFSRFRYVTVPLLLPTILILVLLNLMWSLNAFDLIYALTQGGPGNATKVIAYHIWKQTFSPAADFGGGAAFSYIILMLSLVITWLYARASRAARVQY